MSFSIMTRGYLGDREMARIIDKRIVYFFMVNYLFDFLWFFNIIKSSCKKDGLRGLQSFFSVSSHREKSHGLMSAPFVLTEEKFLC